MYIFAFLFFFYKKWHLIDSFCDLALCIVRTLVEIISTVIRMAVVRAFVWLCRPSRSRQLDIWALSAFAAWPPVWAQGDSEAHAGAAPCGVLGSQGLESLLRLRVGLLQLVIMALCALMRTGLY